MNRDVIESIIQNLDTGVLLRALSSVGINLPQESILDQAQIGGEEPQMESWNQTRVPIGDSKRPPLVDKSKIMALHQGSVARAMRPQAGGMLPDAEPSQMGGNNAYVFG
jgi:hypothetical protein